MGFPGQGPQASLFKGVLYLRTGGGKQGALRNEMAQTM